MILFLSYSSSQHDLAEQVCIALNSARHQVFFDRDSLPAGDDYHQRIRAAVNRSDAFIF